MPKCDFRKVADQQEGLSSILLTCNAVMKDFFMTSKPYVQRFH